MNYAHFLIDTNSFIQPKNAFYPFDFAMTYWNKIEPFIQNGTIVIIDKVKDEIDAQRDELTKWLNHISFSAMSCSSPPIIKEYGNVLTYVQRCGLYKSSALKSWSNDVADPWLIAAAKNTGYPIVTFEAPANNLNRKNPQKSAKIPDVSSRFNVICINLYDLIRELKITI